MLKLFEILNDESRVIAERYIGSLDREPDFVNAPHGTPYLHRWHLVPQNDQANSYFHMLTASDPETSLHYHSWENLSVILAGAYYEDEQLEPPTGVTRRHLRVPGDVIHRDARVAHRLHLGPIHPYSLSLFQTGPKVQDWGYWLNGEAVSNKKIVSFHTATGNFILKAGD